MVGYNFTFIASGLFVVVYVVYYFTSFPSVTGGDSGELLAEACVRDAFLFIRCSF